MKISNLDAKKESTLFLYRKKERPYHVDYIYTSIDFLKNLKILEIGKFDEWIQFSDHCVKVQVGIGSQIIFR